MANPSAIDSSSCTNFYDSHKLPALLCGKNPTDDGFEPSTEEACKEEVCEASHDL